MVSFLLWLTLSQPSPTSASPAEATAPVQAPSPQAADAGSPTPTSAEALVPARNRIGAEAARAIARAMALLEPDRAAAMGAIRQQYGEVDVNPVLPPKDVAIEKFYALPAPAQAGLVARRYLELLLNEDADGLVALSALPFFFEDRRVDRVEDLRSEWARILRSRRTDLLTLYGLNVYSPAEMEKEFGRPPARLSSWNVRAPNTQLAMANLSGHAAVLLLRQNGITWNVCAFHD